MQNGLRNFAFFMLHFAFTRSVMFGNLTYIIWLALFIGVPLLALLLAARAAFWRKWRALAWVLVGALVGGWAWDAGIVRLGAWYYDPNNILGLWVVGLPIEEWLWIVGVTLMFGALTIVLEEKRATKSDT
jgi:lycopene cyclase domain-containing protein